MILAIFLTFRKHSHHFTKREMWAHKTNLTPPLWFHWSTCIKSDKWVVVYLCWEYEFCLFLRICYWTLEMFLQCSICLVFFFCCSGNHGSNLIVIRFTSTYTGNLYHHYGSIFFNSLCNKICQLPVGTNNSPLIIHDHYHMTEILLKEALGIDNYNPLL